VSPVSGKLLAIATEKSRLPGGFKTYGSQWDPVPCKFYVDGKFWGDTGEEKCREIGPVFFNSAGSRVVFFYEVRGRKLRTLYKFVAESGQTGPWDDLGFKRDCVVYSPDGNDLAYGVLYNKRQFVVRDDRAVVYPETHPPRFLHNGSIFLMGKKSRGNYEIVFDDRVYYPRMEERGYTPKILYSADNRHCVFVAEEADGRVAVVHDGVRYPPFADITGMKPSADFSRVIYWARQEARPEVPYRLVVNDKMSKLSAINPQEVVLPNEGGRFAFVDRQDRDSVRLVTDRFTTPFYSRVKDIAFSPDGKRLAYSALRKGEVSYWQAFIDGKEQRYPNFEKLIDDRSSYSRIKLHWSPNGKDLAMELKYDSREIGVFFNGRLGPMLEQVEELCFSADGRHIAYTGKTSKERQPVVVHDSRVYPFVGTFDRAGL
ncbi:MAG: hypothetical protein AAF492_26040, partial [Verrucomicrobiota bacterium]